MSTAHAVLIAKTVNTAVGSLVPIDALAARFGISENVIRELSDAGSIPHYRVKGFDGPLFEIKETRKWIADNLVRHIDGYALPKLEIVVVPDVVSSEKFSSIPDCLASVKSLRELRSELFCGIYFLCLGDAVVYVGQSKNVFMRIQTHRTEKVKEFDRVFFLRVLESQLDDVEKQFIKVLNPSLNGTHSDRTGIPERRDSQEEIQIKIDAAFATFETVTK